MMVLSRSYPESLAEGAGNLTNIQMPATSENGSMSDNSDTSYCGDEKCSEMKGDDICRDYLRNVCKRGKRCKYRHPSPGEAKELGRKHEYTFCHDYQNSGCRRPNCRFLHCTRDEEDYYKQTGQLPARLQQAAAMGIGVLPNELPLLKGEVPVCKDFLKGQCMRAGRCKYRHVTPPQYDADAAAAVGKDRANNGHVEAFDGFNGDDADRYANDYETATALVATTAATKRRRTDDVFASYVGYHRTGQTPMDYALLLEENTMLRRKMEELKKQVSDLAATNEVLLEQNARYRASKVNTVTTVPPVVTVSQVLTPTITPAAAMARPHVAHLPQTMAALTTPAQLTVNGNSELVVSQTTLGPLNTPVSVALNPAQNIVPVSITMDTSMAPPGSMATVTLPQNIGQPPPPVTLTQTTLPTGQALIGSSLSSALVSYPIMSHCVTQLPTSSLG